MGRPAGAAEARITPVLSIEETAEHLHLHLRARATLAAREGVLQSGVAPRFSRTPGWFRDRPAPPGRCGAGA